MTDFRNRLYASYVSSFKKEDARRSERSIAAYRRWSESKLLPLLEGLDLDEPLLEIGCGPGDMLDVLARRGFRRIEGIDVSAEQVEVARERGLAADVADVFAFLEGRREKWSAIVALDFVEHFHRDEVERLLDAVHAALVPGGVFLIQTPNGAGLFPNQVMYGDLTHLTIFAPSSLAQALGAAGFVDPQFRETGPVARGWKGRLRSVLWSGIRLAANAVRMIETGKSQQIWTENMVCRCRKPTRPVAHG